jgi:hypothetical protein
MLGMASCPAAHKFCLCHGVSKANYNEHIMSLYGCGSEEVINSLVRVRSDEIHHSLES